MFNDELVLLQLLLDVTSNKIVKVVLLVKLNVDELLFHILVQLLAIFYLDFLVGTECETGLGKEGADLVCTRNNERLNFLHVALVVELEYGFLSG